MGFHSILAHDDEFRDAMVFYRLLFMSSFLWSDFIVQQEVVI